MTGRLFSKLLLAFLVVIGAGAVVVWGTAWLMAPFAFEEHLAVMARHLRQVPAGAGDLFGAYRRAVNLSVLAAVGASVLVALAVAAFVAGRIAGPVRAMQQAAERIASGDYGERVPVRSRDELGELADQFNRMAAALERLERTRRDLVADVAHPHGAGGLPGRPGGRRPGALPGGAGPDAAGGAAA